MNLLILGMDGQLGSDFMTYAPHYGVSVTGLTRKDLDVTDRAQVSTVLANLEFNVLVNTTAYHGETAYADISPTKHYLVNAIAPYYLAEHTALNNQYLVHFSTDYVFSGHICPNEYSFSELDIPEPSNLYGSSKLAGETIIPIITNNYFIFRIASLYGHRGCKSKNRSNFPETILKKLQKNEDVTVVDDIFMSPTSTKSIVARTIDLLDSGNVGMYHLSGSGRCSWYDFALEIAKYEGYDQERIIRSSYKSIPQMTDRGLNTSLENRNLVESGFNNLSPWQDNLYEYLEIRKSIYRLNQ